MLAKKQLGFAAHRLAHVVVEVGEQQHVRRDLVQIAQLQPLAGERGHQARRRARSAIMRRTCASSTPGARSRPAIARFSSSSSGMLLHRKNDSRLASSSSVTRCAAPAGKRRRVAFRAEQERRTGQNPREAGADAGVEVAARACAPRCRAPAARRCRPSSTGRRNARRATVGQDLRLRTACFLRGRSSACRRTAAAATACR